MKKMLSMFAAGLLFVGLTMPVQAGFYGAAEQASYANQNLALGWLNSTVYYHYADYYNYADSSLIYSAWISAAAATDNASAAWWNAPVGSATEWWAAQAVSLLTTLQDNLWMVYVTAGANPVYITDSIVAAWLAQSALATTAQAAAGWF
jgi:hypothetical protein